MKKLIVAAFLILSASVASADATWCQLSFYSPGDLMLPWARSDVYGLRLDLPYGNNSGKLIGADLGVVGVLGEGMTGLQVTGFNLVDMATVKGFQLGVIANRDRDFHGLQISGMVNWNEDESAGVQIGTVNYGGELAGFQLGGVSWMVGNYRACRSMACLSLATTSPVGLLRDSTMATRMSQASRWAASTSLPRAPTDSS